MSKSIRFLDGDRALDTGPFDLAVIGGGALGCAVAWESASRGLHTVLLEKSDFGSATSANSLGIVHGGLRYLQTLNLPRARASSRERAILLRIAPHLVSPIESLIPTTRSLKRGRLAFAVGLGLNRLVMAGLDRNVLPSHRLSRGGIISAEALQQKAPGLSMKGVTGAASWADGCMVSGERLALAFALSADSVGAQVLNHVDVERGLCDGGRIAGLVVRDRLTGKTFNLDASTVADCRGVGLLTQRRVFGHLDLSAPFVKAVNVVIGDRGLRCAVGAPERDGQGNPVHARLMFARPDRGATIVGTWYFDFVDEAQGLLPAELERILQSINSAFPEWRVTDKDVIDIQVGFLPRKTPLKERPWPIDQPSIVESRSANGPAGVWHIQTEKWTTVRALAERFVTELARHERMDAAPSRTHERALVGGALPAWSARQSALLSTLSKKQASRLIRHYGASAAHVLDYILSNSTLAESLPFAPDVVKAEIAYVLEHELPRTVEDVARRLCLPRFGALGEESLAYLTQFLESSRKLVQVSA